MPRIINLAFVVVVVGCKTDVYVYAWRLLGFGGHKRRCYCCCLARIGNGCVGIPLAYFRHIPITFTSCLLYSVTQGAVPLVLLTLYWGVTRYPLHLSCYQKKGSYDFTYFIQTSFTNSQSYLPSPKSPYKNHLSSKVHTAAMRSGVGWLWEGQSDTKCHQLSERP